MSTPAFEPSRFGLAATVGGDEPAQLPACALEAENLLLGLAYFGEASTAQIRRLWRPDAKIRTTQHALRQLAVRDGLITPRPWALLQRGNAPPRHRSTMWSLSDAGLQLLKGHELFPPAYLPPRSRTMLPHDHMTTEILVSLVEGARAHHLSGVFIAREVQLNPPQRRPVMDALLILRTQGLRARGDTVPWTPVPRVEGERRQRFAIENDRGTESLAVLIDKCLAYQRADTPAWRAAYGPFPRPLLVFPTDQRLTNVMNAWIANWPGGSWLVSTDAWLAQDRWIDYHRGQIRERPFFEARGGEEG